MASTQSDSMNKRENSLEWRLYHNMLVTRSFEDALIRWEHEGKIFAREPRSAFGINLRIQYETRCHHNFTSTPWRR